MNIIVIIKFMRNSFEVSSVAATVDGGVDCKSETEGCGHAKLHNIIVLATIVVFIAAFMY